MEKNNIKTLNSNNIKHKDNSDKNIDILKDVVKEIVKTYGKGSAILLGTDANITIESISSGSILLDNAIGIGGYPKGRIIEIFGPESSGKTTFCLHAIAEVQKHNGKAAFIDIEHALNPIHAQNIGVNINELIISQPDYGEQALDILETLIKTNEIDLIIIDSVSAIIPKKELDGEIGDQTIGYQARLMSKALRKINGIISKTNCVVIFINQIREKIGVMFGNPETTSGGRALRFYSSVRIDLRRIETIKSHNGEPIGINVKAKIVKNKVSSPFRSAVINLDFTNGINKYSEVISLGLIYEVITKKGIWYFFDNQKIGQGKNKTIEFLKSDVEIYKKIKSIIMKKMNIRRT